MTGLQRRSLLTSSAAALAGLAAMPARAGAMSGALQASSVPVTLEMAPPSLPPIPSPAPAPAPVIATPTVPATPAQPRWQRLTTAWTGPDPLRIDLPPAVNLTRLRAAMDAVPATVGLNNHMGSVATRDPALMALVAQEAKARDMLFLDSVVIAHSCAYSAAHDAGVPAAARDIFIDHSSKPEIIRQQLEQIEVQARRHGHVIAIGHPWPHTVAALEEWLPTLQAKGFELWPLSAMVARRNGLTIGA